MILFNSFKKHNELYKKEILDSIENVFDSHWYVLGKEVKNFAISYKNIGQKICMIHLRILKKLWNL